MMVRSFWSKDKVREHFTDYLNQQNVPKDLVDLVMQKLE
jgi:hypothetical protein